MRVALQKNRKELHLKKTFFEKQQMAHTNKTNDFQSNLILFLIHLKQTKKNCFVLKGFFFYYYKVRHLLRSGVFNAENRPR